MPVIGDGLTHEQAQKAIDDHVHFTPLEMNQSDRYAEIQDGKIVSFMFLPKDKSLQECLHADLLDRFVKVEDEKIDLHWTYKNGKWKAP